MTKAKKGIMWSLIAVLAALLVALAAIGITFARYSSSGEGSGSASVAKWDVSVVDASGTTTGAVATFSPSEEEYQESTPRHNESDKILVATAVNGGQVDAAVTITETKITGFTVDADACTESCECVTDGVHSDECECTCDFCTNYSTYSAAISDHFSVTNLYYGSSDSADDATDEIVVGTTEVTVSAGSTVYIFAQVTWTSDVDGCTGDAADAFDTWVGNYISSVSFSISFSAVQTGTSNADVPD